MKTKLITTPGQANLAGGLVTYRLGKYPRFTRFLTIACTLAVLFFSSVGCKKSDDAQPGDDAHAPRKPVPAGMVGEWMYTSVSGTIIQRPNGHSVPAWSLGSVYHLNADGTGFSITSASTNTYTSEDTQRVEETGTFEIELTGEDGLVFKFYPTSGKVYNNDVYAHAVEPSKLYPEKFINWTGQLGENAQGRYFESGTLRYYQK